MLLSVGVLHGELTTLLWGGAFGFLWAYLFVARAATSFAASARTPRGTLDSVPGPELVFRTDDLPPTPVFFGWSLRIEGRHSPRRGFVRRVTLDETVQVALSLPRGRYLVEACWELRDAFGFTRLIPRARWETVVVVEPLAHPLAPPPPPPTRPGPWRPRRSGRRAGDPFDVRPYNPGDDLRRLHWPLFAHSDTPFVRTAEPSPPPTGHQFLVLDTEASSEEELDLRLGALAAWIETLDSQGTGWTLMVPAADLNLAPGSEVGRSLAALTPAPLPERPADPRWPAVVSVLTGPSSVGVQHLARVLAASGRRFSPEVIPPPVSITTKSPWWSRS